MYLMCMSFKYGFGKYGQQCDKSHFTDEYDILGKCTENYCDKRTLRCVFTLESMEGVNLTVTVPIPIPRMLVMI